MRSHPLRGVATLMRWLTGALRIDGGLFRHASVLLIATLLGQALSFLIQVVLRQSSLQVSALVKAATTPAAKAAIAASHSTWSIPALWTFFAGYLVLGGVTWFCYLRRAVLVSRVPSLAHAGV